MLLKYILNNIENIEIIGDSNIEIDNISSNSKEITSNGFFFALQGFNIDGTKFIPDAITNGAKAIALDSSTDIDSIDIPSNITIVKMPNPRYNLAIASCNLYDYPSKKTKLIAVTGTKGKTSSTFMIKSILEAHGYKVGLIGSIAVYIGDKKLEDTNRTTPESYDIQKCLYNMVKEKVDFVVIEVSSQAMKLDRVVGCDFDICLFTNLSEDHISEREHKDMEDYFNAKLSLAKQCPIIVTDLDNNYTKTIPSILPDKLVKTFSIDSKDSNLIASNISLTSSYTQFDTVINGKKETIRVSIPGRFSVYNALGSMLVALNYGVTADNIKNALSDFKVLGRSELVPNKLGLTIMLDYAHTPDSLENILKTVKAYTKGRVICTWGVGGDRDRAKRPIMGEISGRLADLTVLTSDQIRTEDPNRILSDIEVGLKKVNANYVKILHRTEAIKYAITVAKKDDIIVIPGLGHDMYIEYMGVKYPYNEREVIANIIDELLEEGKK